MAIVRENPVPPGTYWSDVEKARDGVIWAALLDANRDRMTVLKDQDIGEGWHYYLYRITAPVIWPTNAGVRFFPNTTEGKGESHEASDTVQRPKVKTTTEIIQGAASSTAKALRTTAYIAAAAGLLYVFTQLRNVKR